MKKYLMMLAAGLLTVSLGGCAVVTDSSQTDSVEVEEVAEEAKDDGQWLCFPSIRFHGW